MSTNTKLTPPGRTTIPDLRTATLVLLLSAAGANPLTGAEVNVPATPATMPSLTAVRLLDGPFADAVKANQKYLLALEPDRLLAPFFREAGLEAKAGPTAIGKASVWMGTPPAIISPAWRR
jgi:hypothetical protein